MHGCIEARTKIDRSKLDTVEVDEISVKKGHSYVTLFYDLNTSRVIHIENGKKQSVFKNFREVLSKKTDSDNIRYMSMDMYPAFKGLAREYLDKWHYWGTHSNIKEIIT